jgi:hypothetical protein
MAETVKVMTSEETKQLWVNLSGWYTTYAEQQGTQLFQSYLPFLKLESA